LLSASEIRPSWEMARNRPTITVWRRTIYPTLVLVSTWSNVIRFCSTFTKEDADFGLVLVEKLTFFSIFLECALVTTSYYIALRNGKLHFILRKSKVTAEFVDKFRKPTISCVVIGVLMSAFNYSLLVCVLFFTDGSFDFLVAPFVTQIQLVGGWLQLVKCSLLIIFLINSAAWLWLMMMNSLLTQLLYRQFQIYNARFHSAIDKQGKFNGNLRTFRNRHQALSSASQR